MKLILKPIARKIFMVCTYGSYAAESAQRHKCKTIFFHISFFRCRTNLLFVNIVQCTNLLFCNIVYEMFIISNLRKCMNFFICEQNYSEMSKYVLMMSLKS